MSFYFVASSYSVFLSLHKALSEEVMTVPIGNKYLVDEFSVFGGRSSLWSHETSPQIIADTNKADSMYFFICRILLL